jgi:Putative antitoxin of bacterial toxin-antitoxin system, YdaS/YdaT
MTKTRTRAHRHGPKRAVPVPRAKPRRVRSLQKFLKAYGPGAEGARLRTQFAKRMGTSLPYLIAIAWGYRIASVGMAIKIERASHGLVTREDLRPEEDWASFAPRGELQHAAA